MFKAQNINLSMTTFNQNIHALKFLNVNNYGYYLGKHNYLHILTIHLDDFCEKGEAWNSWQNLSKFI